MNYIALVDAKCMLWRRNKADLHALSLTGSLHKLGDGVVEESECVLAISGVDNHLTTLSDLAAFPMAPHLLHSEIVESNGISFDLQALQARYSSYHRMWSISPRTVMSFPKCCTLSAGSTASRIYVVSFSVQSEFAARNLDP